jgi:iron complex transport system ATP-binding protein
VTVSTRGDLIPGVHYAIADGLLRISSDADLAILSSAVVGGGPVTCRDIVNLHVGKGYASDRPEDDLRAAALGAGIGEPFVGLMTAAYVERAGVARREAGDLRFACVATAGVTNATQAGREAPGRLLYVPGTINIVVLVDGNLAPAAAVNLIITATEAKTLTLLGRQVRTPDGLVASGTSTDSVVVAHTGRGEALRYAGPATLVGHLAAECVREAVGASLDRARG